MIKKSELWKCIAVSIIVLAAFDYFNDRIESAQFNMGMALIDLGISWYYERKENKKKKEEE